MFRKITKGLKQNLSIILQEFHIIAILENPSKDDLKVNSRENNYRRFPLQQILMLEAKTTLPKKNSIMVFF